MQWQQEEGGGEGGEEGREEAKERGGGEGTGRRSREEEEEEEEEEKKNRSWNRGNFNKCTEREGGRVNRERGNGVSKENAAAPNDGRYAATAAELPING